MSGPYLEVNDENFKSVTGQQLMDNFMGIKEAKFYKVGGFVRDALLAVESKDIDFAVEAESYDAMKSAIIARGCDIKVEKPEFATLRAVHPVHGGVDFVLCRKDGYYTDGRRPDSVEAGTLHDDLARRDFTVNALAQDDDTGEIIDPFGGQMDLKARLINTVGAPEVRFGEDSLRILRALRFVVTKNFILSGRVHHCLSENFEVVGGLKNISEERVREELYRMFKFSTWRSFAILQQFDLVRYELEKNFPRLWLKPTLEDK